MNSCHIHFVGACLSYEPIEGSDSIFSDFNTTTCKHLKAGPREYIEISKVKIDPSCIPDAHSHVSIQMIGFLVVTFFRNNFLCS